MKRHILLTFVLLISLFQLVNAYAWNSETHQLLVENVYYSMPTSLQEKLNLSEMKKAATDPDLVFHDTVNHHYPVTKDLAYKYLEKANSLETFSYNFGVASHYIADSFVAPHSVSGEDSYLHSKFEKQVNGYTINVSCANYNFTLDNLEISAKNKDDWPIWLKNQDKTIPQKELEQAQQFIYSLAIQKLSYECNSKLAYEEKSILPNISVPEIPNKELSYPVLLASAAIFLFYKFFKKKRKLIALTILLLLIYLGYKLLF